MKKSMLAASALMMMAASGLGSAVGSGGSPGWPEARSSGNQPSEFSATLPQKAPTTRPGDTNGLRGWRRYLGGPPNYPRYDGYSVKQGQRMARKLRNQLKNRRAQR